jgi:hypothetical protein
MKQRVVALPTLGLIAGTRVTLGAGIGLLLARRLSPEVRRAAGWTLLAIGALSTIPLAMKVFGSEEPEPAGTRTPWPTHHAPEGPHQPGPG